MKKEIQSKDITKLLSTNQLVKKVYEVYTIFPTGNIIGTDESRVMMNCMVYMRTEHAKVIFDAIPYIDNSALTIYADKLFEATKKDKKLISALEVDNDMNLYLWKGAERFLIGQYNDLSTVLMSQPYYTIYEREVTDFIELTQRDIEVINSRSPLMLTNGFLTVKTAKPLYPFIAKTEISYVLREIDERQFYAYIRMVREGVELITRYQCFKY